MVDGWILALPPLALGSCLHGRELDRGAGAAYPPDARVDRELLPGHQTGDHGVQLGAPEHVNSALAQADVLGIFGREGVDLATLWWTPVITQPAAFAFRNYDGAGSTFGETSVSATSTDQEKLTIYGAQRSADRALTLVVINKSSAAITSTVTLAGFTPAAAASVYRYSAGSPEEIVRGQIKPLVRRASRRASPSNRSRSS